MTHFLQSSLEAPPSSALDLCGRLSVRAVLLESGSRTTMGPECVSVVIQVEALAERASSIKSLEGSPTFALRKPADVCLIASPGELLGPPSSAETLLLLEVPRNAIRTYAARNCKGNHAALHTGGVHSDGLLHLLSRTLTRFLREDATASTSFSEHFISALYSHLIERYGMHEEKPVVSVGGLSPRNRRITESVLLGMRGYQVSLESLSAECRLSERHFARAFQQSFGIPFHQLQLDMRIQRAIHLLTRTSDPLKSVASELGYSDQATFTESFTRELGIPPGRYRRQFWVSDSDAAIAS